METIIQHFEASRETRLPKVFILLGMGGCGKSQLALEYCHEAETNKTYSAIFWIDATSPTTAQQSISTIAKAMSKPAFDIADDEGNLKFVLNTTERYRERWLFIFDNFDDPSLLAIQALESEEALDLLLKRSQAKRTDTDVQEGQNQQTADDHTE